MSTSRHRQFHKDLNEYLYQQRDAAGNHMRAQSNNSGFDIQQKFTPQQRIEAMRMFYDTNKWTYPGVRYDFYRNSGLRWSPW